PALLAESPRKCRSCGFRLRYSAGRNLRRDSRHSSGWPGPRYLPFEGSGPCSAPLLLTNPMPIELFPRDQIVGVFKGFQEGGLEFHADLVLPYRSEFQNVPMHGQFLLVQLENPNEAVLGRITAFSSEGKLASGAGEEFNIRAVREDRPVPEEL